MTIAFPDESASCRVARHRLLAQEIELRRATEAVAAARRALPAGGPVPEDYIFQGAAADGAPTNVKLSDLFELEKNSLVIYNFMFPRDPDDISPGPAIGKTALLPLDEGPCPSCTALLDQLGGAAEHAKQHLNFAVVAKTSLPRLLNFGAERGWRRLRLLSSAANTYNRDCHGETGEGLQRPMLNVFVATRTQSATSGAQSSSTPRRTAIRSRATSAPSSRSGISSISPPRDVRTTGGSS